MSAGHIAVLDIGKTSVKLVLIRSDDGAETATRTLPNACLPGPPYPHADVEGIWTFLVETLSGFAQGHLISGISITTHGATAALMKGDELALPVLDYEHDGPRQTEAEYDTIRPAFAETLSPRLPVGLNLGAQLFWLSESYSDAFARVDALLMYPQYWAFRLTGQMATEVTSLGCHTDMWSPHKSAPSTLMSGQNWTRLLRQQRRADETIGTLRPDVASLTGLPVETPVKVGIHDSNASLLPHLRSRTAPFNVISSGTWTIHMHVGGDNGKLDPERDSLANIDYLGRPVPTARFMGGREFEALAGRNAPSPTLQAAQKLIDLKVMALPAFVPGVGPFPHLSGRIEGPHEDLDPVERATLASLYLALNSTAALEICGAARDLIVEGPLARNEVYLGILAALCRQTVIASPDTTGTSMGAAMLFAESGLDSLSDGDLDFAVTPADLRGLKEYAARWRKAVDLR